MRLLLISIFFIAKISSGQNTEIDATKNTINDFHLKSTSGNDVSLSDYQDAKGFIIIFTSNHCPFAKLYPERLNELYDTYLPKQVPLIAIRSTQPELMPDDSFEKMEKLAKKQQLKYPFLADDKQDVAKNFHADKTPHAFVIWKENNQWVIKYSGAIDDNGAEPEKVTHAYVKEAIEALLTEKEVAIPVTKTVGCQIKFR